MATQNNKNKAALFYEEWWERISYKSDEVQHEIVERYFNHCFGIQTFDPDAFSKDHRPTEAEIELIFMVRTYEADKAAYLAKCETNSRNRRMANAPEPTSIESDECEQLQAIENKKQRPSTTVNDRQRKPTEANVRQDNDNDNDNDLFFLAPTGAREADASQKEKKELLLNLTFYFLGQGVKRAYTEAERAWNYNEANGWMSENKNGSTKDHSKNKLAYLKGWSCERATYGMDHGQLFADFCRATGMTDVKYLDSYCGSHYTKEGVCFHMTTKKTADDFMAIYRADLERSLKGVEVIKQFDKSLQGFAAIKNPSI